MHQMFLCVLFATLLVCSEGVARGQSSNEYVRAVVESLDRIEPIPIRSAKPIGKAYTIKIKTQADFDKLNGSISDAIKAGKTNIRVKIGNGVFRFRENHILRSNENLPDVSISIEGKRQTLLTSDEENVTIGGIMSDYWQDMMYAEGRIEVVDVGKKLCRIPYSNRLSVTEWAGIRKVQVTEWFRAPIYDIEKTDECGVYFVATDLQTTDINGRKGYNVNYDYLYCEKTPRFRLYDTNQERQCGAARWLYMERSRYRQVVIKNLHFVSNKAGTPLITLANLSTLSIDINNCSFEYIRGTVMTAGGTANIAFNKNVVRHTAGDELRFLSNCENVRVTNNLFENCGKSISNSFCVNCREATYYIAHNIFRDFGYGAIGVGVWHGFEKKYYSGGIIEHNEIYFSPEYFANAWKYMLMDSGAIYTWTQNDEVIIRYNFIHDYVGAGSNRGIFCDDGACNLKIYGNVILNVPNSYCIDSRKSKDQHKGFTNNANNLIAHNIMDGRMRFQGYGEEERHCVKGTNYFVSSDNVIENKYDDLEISQEDVIVSRLQEIKDSKLSKRIKDFKISGSFY